MSNSSKEEPERFKAPEKFYVAEKADNEVGLNRLVELIPYQCTVTASDCYAVLLSLEHNIASELDQGCIVKLRRLGNFQVGISSEEKEIASEAQLSPKDIFYSVLLKSYSRC
ncbi:HU family DNA-binding protein [Flavobacterium restrictum]|uniref:HU family DNA-binding protein n=1 Tax=Flavobacterium restrictum TaxID=2594428 RepID=UPI001F1DDDCA|nr:DNA-binding protein [Flavobacterium restrictum]